MACPFDSETRKDKAAYRVLIPWHVTRTRSEEIGNWLRTDETTGTWATEPADKDGEPMVATFFSDLATATAFKLKFG